MESQEGKAYLPEHEPEHPPQGEEAPARPGEGSAGHPVKTQPDMESGFYERHTDRRKEVQIVQCDG